MRHAAIVRSAVVAGLLGGLTAGAAGQSFNLSNDGGMQIGFPQPPKQVVVDAPSPEALALRAEIREYKRQLTALKRRYLEHPSPERRAEGLARLREFTDPAAFETMVEVFDDADARVRNAVLDHIHTQGPAGEGALTYLAVHGPNGAYREGAAQRLPNPATPGVMYAIDSMLIDEDAKVAGRAAALASHLNAVSLIPRLIQQQLGGGGGGGGGTNSGDRTGDLAWIAVATQQVYVQDLIPLTGDSSGAYQPVVGVVSDGFVMRVLDAVVIEYRTEIHYHLVELTSRDWGKSTEHLAYDPEAWWTWYRQDYLPFKDDQRRLAELAAAANAANEDAPPFPDPTP